MSARNAPTRDRYVANQPPDWAVPRWPGAVPVARMPMAVRRRVSVTDLNRVRRHWFAIGCIVSGLVLGAVNALAWLLEAAA